MYVFVLIYLCVLILIGKEIVLFLDSEREAMNHKCIDTMMFFLCIYTQ